MSAHEAGHGEQRQSPFVPVLLVAVAFVTWTGFQTVELARESEALSAAHLAQAPQVAEAEKLRASLDSVASETRKLADAGNADAKLIVDELKKRGITITPGQQPTPPPP
jgi:hypothetical protein